MKRDSRYLKVLQRVPRAEKGCKERYSDMIGVLKTESKKDLELHTDYTSCVEIMLGVPIIAPEYRYTSNWCMFCTCKGRCREVSMN